jgi:hypothetical protein
VQHVELGHAPQAGIDGVRRVIRRGGVQEAVLRQVPHHAALHAGDADRVGQAGDVAAARIREVARVIEGQDAAELGAHRPRGVGGGLGLRRARCRGGRGGGLRRCAAHEATDADRESRGGGTLQQV